MCGIWCCLGEPCPADMASACVNRLEARGPEGTRLQDVSGVGTLGFTRLAINGLNDAGMQPMEYEGITWVCNGEIYNWRVLAAEYGIPNASGSDCEVLGELYDTFCEMGIPLDEFFRSLDGVFAIIIVDQKRGRVVVGRDPYGVRPLYMGSSRSQKFFGSEMKSLTPVCYNIEAFLPGHYQIIVGKSLETYRPYHTVPFLKNPLLTKDSLEMAMWSVRSSISCAVHKRLMTERPVAALLSGGLDSSLIAALVAKELHSVGAPTLQTFSIGMEGSSDLFHAQKVASWIGSHHTQIVMTPQQFFDAIPAVIRDIESYDTTTVRASVGNWLVSKVIAEKSNCKVVFNGDGADEVWGSYLYFYNAPSEHAYEAEVTRLLTDIHLFDVLRSDRCISSHGLEPRTPFLDKQFVAVARSIETHLRRPERYVRQEKWLMRKAFDNGELLPKEVLWRQKEAFSDGVSGTEKSWYQVTQEMALEKVGVDWKVDAIQMYGKDAPDTAEKFYYRKIYDEVHGSTHASVNVPYFWMPKWSPGATDPSARTLSVYSS